MAEQISHDVVNQAQSVGDPAPIDVSATKTNDFAARAVTEETIAASTPNDIFIRLDPTHMHNLADGGRRSATSSPLLDANTLQEKTVLENYTDSTSQSLEQFPKINGAPISDNDHADELLAQQTAVDGSVGSDTDTSRAEILETAGKDGAESKHHVRSNSVKKPTTFKAVSVTKNFLAKAGTASAPGLKGSNEKALPPTAGLSGNTLPLVARPRLVAKSISGHRASAPKSASLASRNGGGSGPDPNQVWNRNRPAPPTAPKHFTDEELKQQYGIHLATRLQADGDGKEAKWADIDDDEDDWAPETIEWNDGTKMTLAHTDPTAAFAEEQAAVLASRKKEDEMAKAKMSPPRTTSTVGPNATVLRLSSAGQPKAGGLILKAPSDKPTLVAKPSAPAPVRSPWASLPPVEKLPPVPISAPTQLPQSRLAQKDPYGFESMPPPPSPAMEIAADDFTRVRRDAQNGSRGQLYNSQSGQYEPVNDARRGSVRKEQNFRPPSLLQRSSPSDQHGPAEPSAAFQTHRSGSQQDSNSWSRRRASSTVSGDSGNQGRRSSIVQSSDLPRVPSDVHEQGIESQSQLSPLTPGPSENRPNQPDMPLAPQSPALINSQQSVGTASSVASPQQYKVTPVTTSVPNPTPDGGQELIIANQKRLMREKRELAVKRKKEEEEREDAEKKERIRIKMEQLGLPPLTAKKEVKSEIPEVSIQSQEVPTLTPRSPPKPPVPDASGAPKQYGLMKVHGPSSKSGPQQVSENIEEEAPKALLPIPPVQPPSHAQRPSTDAPKTSSLVNGDSSNKHTGSASPVSPDSRAQSLHQGSGQHLRKNVPDTDTYTNWSGAGMTTHSSPGGNLWGPPLNHKALGNGTFDRNVQRQTSRQSPFQEHFMSPPPQPIGPPKHVQPLRDSLESRTAPEVTSKPSVEESQTVPTFPSPEGPPALTKDRNDVPNQLNRVEKAIQPVQATPAIMQSNLDRPREPEHSRYNLAAWGNFHATSAKEEAEKTRKAIQENAAQLAEEERTGIRHEIQMPIMNETWRQVKVNEQVGRSVVGVSKTPIIQGPVPTSQMNGDIRVAPLTKPSNFLVATGAGRGSRFFPSGGQVVQPPPVISNALDRPVSPPPPDSADHPAYARDQQRPLVNLPLSTQKPKPVVKLPPSFATPLPSPPVPEIRAMPLRAASQPLVNNPSWQERFNGLLGKIPSPEKKFITTVDFSTTKVPLETPLTQNSTPVSLPPKGEDHTAVSVDRGETASKATEDEEALFENREFGSLPTVRIPEKAPPNVWPPAKPPKMQRAGSRLFKETAVFSIEPFVPNPLGKEHHGPNGPLIFIKMPGMATAKSKTMPRLNQRSQGSQRPRHTSVNPKTVKSFKPRDSSANYGSRKPTQNGLQKPSMQTGSNQQPPSNFNGTRSQW